MPTGYHFTGDTLRDGSPVPPTGHKLVFEGKIEICTSGLHWSEHPFDALQYAPGKWLHLVKCSEPAERQDDKCVSAERTILKTIDAEYLMYRFAADQALSVAHLWDMPPVVYEYLTTLDKALRNAAWAAVRAAECDAAWDAAWDAARAAARDAVRAAAWDAVWAAARAAARDAERDAVRAAARDAAWDAARDAARADFKKLVDLAFAQHKE